MKRLARLLPFVALIGAGCSGLVIGGPRYGDTIDGIACDTGHGVAYEATVHLSLIEPDGTHVLPTGGVGSTGSCDYWVFTPPASQVVEVRAPHRVSPTLQTFLTIWQLAIPRGSGNASAFVAAAEHGRIVVNGTPVSGGPAAVSLTDGSVIELRTR